TSGQTYEDSNGQQLACGNAMSNSTGSQSTGCSSTMYCSLFIHVH
ncbi:unnamed protein product, partial [Adineta steineri]